MFNRRLVYIKYKELSKLKNKKENNPIGKCTKEGIHITYKQMKSCSAASSIREMQIKPTVKYHYETIRMMNKKQYHHQTLAKMQLTGSFTHY